MRSYSAIACGVLVSCLLVAFASADVMDTHKYVYGLIIDAGSSGSRIYIYTWLQRKDNSLPDLTTAPLNQTQWSKKISPGLATFATNLTAIPAYLAPLIKYAQDNLNAADVPNTVLYLRATGGLRAISESDQTAVISATRQYLRTTPFNFTDSQAGVIQLDQEALYGWITVNYVTKSLGKDPTATLGALDMGGATTEISFVPADQKPLSHNSAVTLAGQTYNVYTGGYAARGLDTALALTITQLISQANEGTADIVNPCYLVGWSEPVTVTASNGSLVTYTVRGSGDSTACRSLVASVLLDTSVSCPIPNCPFNGMYEPPLHGNFVGYSGYYYTYDFFFPQHNTVTITQYVAASVAYCGMSFSAAQAAYPSTGASFLKNYCFTSSYIPQLLSIFGFAPDSTNITYVSTVNGYEVSWAMGAMLYEANLIPFIPDTTTGGSSTTSGAVPTAGLSIFTIFAFISVILSILY